MNFADAIRKVSVDPQVAPVLGLGEETPQTPQTTYNLEANSGVPTFGLGGLSADPQMIPAPTNPAVQSGNVVRLELFLSAEQMSGLFRAIMAGQHTVMTAREAAAYLRIGKETLMKLAEEGDIPGIVIDGRWRFPKPNLDEWLTMQSMGHEEIEDVA
ncbi:MAG: helix-turn-helix domain-containing protein [Fimbriimonadaceae bacterium]